MVVVAGGETPDRRLAAAVPAPAVVVAADSGVDHAHRLGLAVDLAVGDFDSVSPAGLAAVEAQGGRITRHPAAKDATDLELALCAARALDPERIVVIGAHGGRTDHHLSLPLILTAPWLAGITVEAWTGTAHLTVIRHRAMLEGQVGELVSLLPIHGPAVGITTRGLAYPLVGEDLPAGTTRGVSNVFTAPTADVRLEAGVLLAVAPDALAALPKRPDRDGRPPEPMEGPS